jgi:HYDIN/CFA65/VesB-like, Ig-like domain/PQQ-like domain
MRLLDALPWTPVIGADGTLYYADQAGLHASEQGLFDKWTFLPPGGGGLSLPAIGPDGTIYVASSGASGNVYAINPDGTQKWMFAPSNGVTSDLTIGTDGTIYFNDDDGNLDAINPEGNLKWQFANAGLGLIAGDGTIYACDTGNIYEINPDGSLKGQFTNSAGCPVMMGPDGTLYDSTGALNPDGTRKWTFSIVDYNWPPAFGPDGTVYLVTSSAYLEAINPGNGAVKWGASGAPEDWGGDFFTIGPFAGAGPAVGADGTIYFSSNCWWNPTPDVCCGIGETVLNAVKPNFVGGWETVLAKYTDGFEGDMATSPPAIGVDGTVYQSFDTEYLYSVTLENNARVPEVPSSLALPSSSIGDTVTNDLTVKNNGTSALFITAATSSDPAEFTVTTNACPAGGVAAGGSCAITIAFTPNALGARTATLTLSDNTSSSPQSVALSGTGTASTPTPIPTPTPTLVPTPTPTP